MKRLWIILAVLSGVAFSLFLNPVARAKAANFWDSHIIIGGMNGSDGIPIKVAADGTIYTSGGGGGSGFPGGSDTQVQFNDSGTFNGDSTFVFNKTSKLLSTSSVKVGTLNGVIKATSGTLGLASAGTDYQSPIAYTTENVANKDTTAALGTSDTKYPSQNAVKSYVDTGLSGKLATTAIDDTAYGSGWSADTTHSPTKNAVYNKIQAISSGGSTPPGGSNTNVQFNDNNSFSGDSTFTYNKTTKTVGMDNISVTSTGSSAFNSVVRFNTEYASMKYTDTISGGTWTGNWNNGNVRYVALGSGANTANFTNPLDGGRYAVILKQPSSGAAATVTFTAPILWSNGTIPTLSTTNKKADVITFIYDGTNSKYMGGYSLNY